MDAFAYRRPATLDEAAELFAKAGDARFLAGGHTLLPTMKNRLDAPDMLIDLRAIPDLSGIRREGDRLEIGAASTHAAIAGDEAVRDAIPALAAMAASIGDPQVRALGTIGGAVANDDPSADYPAAVLALGADIVTDRRTISVDDYFEGLFTTALEEGEIVVRVSFPIPEAAGYAKLCSQASRYAVVGVFVARTGAGARVAVTGAGSDGVFRWQEAEAALDEDFRTEALGGLRPDADEMISDLNGPAAWRAQLVAVMARRAMEHLGGAFVR